MKNIIVQDTEISKVAKKSGEHISLTDMQKGQRWRFLCFGLAKK